MPFQVNNKIMLLLGEQEFRAQLVDRITATGSFSQFEHHVLEHDSRSPKTETVSASFSIAPEDDFDSLWKSL